jgi:hypothetical protein
MLGWNFKPLSQDEPGTKAAHTAPMGALLILLISRLGIMEIIVRMFSAVCRFDFEIKPLV